MAAPHMRASEQERETLGPVETGVSLAPSSTSPGRRVEVAGWCREAHQPHPTVFNRTVHSKSVWCTLVADAIRMKSAGHNDRRAPPIADAQKQANQVSR